MRRASKAHERGDKKRGNHGRVLLKEKLALNYRVKAYASLSSHRRRIGEDRPVLRFTGDPIPYTVTLNDDGTVSLENSGIL